MNKLNKKHKYHSCFCPNCETPSVCRKQTKKELEEWQNQFPDKGSVSKFEQSALVVVVPCKCQNQPDMSISFPISFKRANEILEGK